MTRDRFVRSLAILTAVLAGWSSQAAAFTHSVTLLPYGSSGYRYQVYAGTAAWPFGIEGSAFNDESFLAGVAPFGGGIACPVAPVTNWPLGTKLAVRRHFNALPGITNCVVYCAIDNTAQIYVNGRLVGSLSHQNCANYDDYAIQVPPGLIHDGDNLLVALCADDFVGGDAATLDVSVAGISQADMSPYFIDEFLGPTITNAWTAYPNGGTVTLADGMVTIAGSGVQFPYVVSNASPIQSGDFVTTFRMKYNSVTARGTGISWEVGTRANGANSCAGISVPQFNLWQDLTTQSTFAYSLSTPCGYTRSQLAPAPDLNWHEYALSRSQGRFALVRDGQLIWAARAPLSNSPPLDCWFGNPTNQGSSYPWTSFSLDYIHVAYLPAFEITSASFDKSRYTSGDLATLTVNLRSNRAAGGVQVAPVLKPHFGQSTALGPMSVSLTPGTESSKTFTWSVPPLAGQAMVDLSVSADGGGYGISNLVIPSITVVNELTAAAISAAQQQLQACGTTPEEACGLTTPGDLLVGMIPFVGSALGVRGMVGDGCLATQYWNQNRPAQSAVMWIATAADAVGFAVSAVGDAACVGTGGAGCVPAKAIDALAGLAPGLVTAAASCFVGVIDAPLPSGSARTLQPDRATTSGDLMTWLPDSLQLAFANAGDTLADLALCSGDASLRIEADSCFTTADSVGNAGVVVLRVGSQALQCAAIRPGAARLFGVRSNVTNASTIRLAGNSADTCKFVLFHRRATGEVLKLEYAPFFMDSGGGASIAVAKDSTSSRLLLDQNGDGVTDRILYPGGATVSVDDPSDVPSPSRSSIRPLGNTPNPFFGSTTLHFRITGTPTDAHLLVRDIAGRAVVSRSLGTLTAGDHGVVWNGRNAAGRKVPAGVYFYQLVHSGGASAPGRLVVLQ